MSLEQEIENIIDRKVEERITQIEKVDFRPWIFSVDVAEMIGYTEEWVLKKYTKNTLLQKKKLIKKQGGKWVFKHPEFLQYIHENF